MGGETSTITTQYFKKLSENVDGHFFYDKLMKVAYTLNAPTYKEHPIVIAPKNKKNLKHLIYFAKIIDYNIEEQWAKVQLGIIRDELNAFLEAFGYFFRRITSTANRATISGMIGNQTLFPAIRNKSEHSIIVANGKRCHHQINDGTSENAMHPIEQPYKQINAMIKR